jgi:hypothetical protein
MVPGRSYTLDVWMHLAAQRREVIARAKESQHHTDIWIKSKGGVAIVRGAIIEVHVSIPTLVVDDCDDVMAWEGDIANATFPITIPVDAEPGTHAGYVAFYAEGLQIAKLHFLVDVRRNGTPSEPIHWSQERYRTAFASYASKDRDEVLARVQGIQKAIPNLDIFLDVASLRSGEKWAERLLVEVTGRDVFYLFWSLNAKNSTWVEKEWRTALEVRGIDYIDPVPLVPPDEAPPPPELATHLHFNDWTLAYRRGMRSTSPRD